jgi:thymidylate synthase (FAD)
MAQVKLVHTTPDAESLIAMMARVSNPKNKNNPEYSKLIGYLIKQKHWSPFEMATMCLEIETTRAISPQILRHKSFFFQEYSQRYQVVDFIGFSAEEARQQDLKNRQNSTDTLDESTKQWFIDKQNEVWNTSKALYDEAISKGIAKECARGLLPLNTKTNLYMHGTVRSWIHYIELRSANGTQKEHQDIALMAKDIFVEQFPKIAEALEWKKR